MLSPCTFTSNQTEFILLVFARALGENEKWFLNFICFSKEGKREMLIWFGKLFLAGAHSKHPSSFHVLLVETWRWLLEFSLLLFARAAFCQWKRMDCCCNKSSCLPTKMINCFCDGAYGAALDKIFELKRMAVWRLSHQLNEVSISELVAGLSESLLSCDYMADLTFLQASRVH